jgi:hypothetical protein
MTNQQEVLGRLREQLERTEDNLLPEETIALSRARANALSGGAHLSWRGFYPSMALLALLIATATLFDTSFYNSVNSESFNQVSTNLDSAPQAITDSETWSNNEGDELDVYYWLAESSEELNALYGWNSGQ